MPNASKLSHRIVPSVETLEDRAVPAGTVQITDGDPFGSGRPSINGDGTRIAFASEADLTGQNPDNSEEIFLFDTAANQFTQITNVVDADGGEGPSINGDGTRIAFHSEADFTGQNPDGSEEIFFFDTTTNEFTQVTSVPGGEGFSRDASISADGTRIAFESNSDLTGQNPDGSFEIFLYDVDTGDTTQITNILGGERNSGDPSANFDGTRIAFESGSDLTGQNPNFTSEIFLFDTNTNSFTQITDDEGSGGSSTDPSINYDGTQIAFDSRADLTGQNGDNSREIFLHDTTTGETTQISNDPTDEGDSTDPVVNSDGTRIAFESDSDLTGQNADGTQEVFLFDTVTGVLAQITDSTTGFSEDPTINVDGTRIAFDFANFFDGESNDVNVQQTSNFPQIFLHDTVDRNMPLTVSGTDVDPAVLDVRPYGDFLGEVRIATGDVNGDGVLDVITGPGIGGGPHVKVFDGTNGNLIRDFFAFDPGFMGGIFVSTADVDRDRFDDIVVGAGPGGGPHVRVFSGQTGEIIRDFFAYAPTFAAGVRVSSGDMDGDGFAEIVTGAGPGGGPHVKVFDGLTGAERFSFFAFDPSFTGGVYVAAGDLNRDGLADIIVGAGEGGGPQVRGFSGLDPNEELVNFFAYDPAFTGGVRVGVKDTNADVVPEIVTGAGPGAGSHIKTFDSETLEELDSFFAFDPIFTSGVFVDGV